MMAENVERSDESEFGSVTSSQRSFLKNCPFADLPGGEEDTASDTTEVLGTPISQPVTRTPILSLSTPISDEDVFRTPPENASLSSAAESEPRARVSEIKPRRGGGGTLKLKSKSPPPVFASPSLAVKNARVLETNRIADPDESVAVTDVTPVTSPPSFAAAGDVKVLPGGGGGSKSKSPPPVSASQPPTPETVMVLEMNRVSDPEERVTEVRHLSSPPSLAAGNVRVTGNHSDSESLSPPTVAAGDVRVPDKPYDPSTRRKQPDLDSSPQFASEGTKVTESGDDDDYETEKIPFKQVIEALLRNSGENLDERDERVSYVEILKRLGLKFP